MLPSVLPRSHATVDLWDCKIVRSLALDVVFGLKHKLSLVIRQGVLFRILC